MKSEGYRGYSVTIPMGYGERIDQLMQGRNMNCCELARRIGCERKTMYRMIDGDVGVKVSWLMSICDIFGVGLDWLIFGKEKQ